MVRDPYHNFSQPNGTSSNDLLCHTNIPKPKYIQCTMIQNREKQQVLTLEKLEAANVWHLGLINAFNN